jgi:hypothetical protein
MPVSHIFPLARGAGEVSLHLKGSDEISLHAVHFEEHAGERLALDVPVRMFSGGVHMATLRSCSLGLTLPMHSIVYHTVELKIDTSELPQQIASIRLETTCKELSSEERTAARNMAHEVLPGVWVTRGIMVSANPPIVMLGG